MSSLSILFQLLLTISEYTICSFGIVFLANPLLCKEQEFVLASGKPTVQPQTNKHVVGKRAKTKMGNTPTPAIPEMLLKDYEHKTAQRLIRGIKANSRRQMEESYDAARKELLTANTKVAHDKEYEIMVKSMIAYLTRGYDVGDGMVFTKTPLEIAREYHADEAIAFIEEKLEQLQKSEVGSKEVSKRGVGVAPTSSAGKVDKDRVAQAKDRLRQFQNERKK